MDQDPTSFTWLTYGWVLLLAGLGGVVNFVRRIREGESNKWNLAELIGEIATSAFAGLITFYLCEAANISHLIGAALVGISGHMGSRAIFLFEIMLKKRMQSFHDDVLPK
jgi:drug/metabolite transporter (DMT)-like permease